jgi:hypothetical protein
METFMKTVMRGALAAAALVSLSSGLANAQVAERVYDNGPVWEISYVETKPGMFDDYMAYLSTKWRDVNEADKRSGRILDYKVLAVASPRDHEPDVLLMIEYPNMAAFDRPLAEDEATMSKVFGSVVKSNQAFAARDSLRTSRGGVLAREMKFTK